MQNKSLPVHIQHLTEVIPLGNYHDNHHVVFGDYSHILISRVRLLEECSVTSGSLNSVHEDFFLIPRHGDELKSICKHDFTEIVINLAISKGVREQPQGVRIER